MVLSDSFESAKPISMGPTSKTSSKLGKIASNGISKHSNRTVSSVCFSYFDFYLLKFNANTNYLFCGLIRESYQQKVQGQIQLRLFRRELFSHKLC